MAEHAIVHSVHLMRVVQHQVAPSAFKPTQLVWATDYWTGSCSNDTMLSAAIYYCHSLRKPVLILLINGVITIDKSVTEVDSCDQGHQLSGKSGNVTKWDNYLGIDQKSEISGNCRKSLVRENCLLIASGEAATFISFVFMVVFMVLHFSSHSIAL